MPTARHPPRVCARNAVPAEIRWAGSWWKTAARIAAHGANGVTGVSEPNARDMPFATMAANGMSLAFGSDTPVTPFAPWAAIRAAVFHHEPAQRISAGTAFLAHTRGGWRAVGIDDRGYLDLGQPATFAIWSLGNDDLHGTTRLPELSPGATPPANLRTVIRGRTVFDLEGAFS